MNAIDRLLANYRRHVALPWAQRLAGAQRVWLAVYPPTEERRLRQRLEEFALATRDSGHNWLATDLTHVVPRWLAEHPSAAANFAEPEFLQADQVEPAAADQIKAACGQADANTVVAVTGCASLFNFVRISRVLAHVESEVQGRLLLFFPGAVRGTTYRFMDARDGFNYLAVPITCEDPLLSP